MIDLFNQEQPSIRDGDAVNLKKLFCFIAIFMVALSRNAFSLVEEIYERDVPVIQGATVGPLGEDPFSGGLIGFTHDKSWRLLPGFEYKTTYDSNVNREQGGDKHKKDEDQIFHYIPSIAIIRKGTRFSVRSIYQLDVQEFLANANENTINHNISNSIQYVSPKVTAGIDYTFSYFKAAASDEITKRRTLINNEIQPKFEYQLTRRLNIAPLYRNYELAYKDVGSKDESYRRQDIGGRIKYHLNPKIDLFTEASDLIVRYERKDDLDSDGFVIWGGSNVKITDKLYLNLKPGAKVVYPKNSTINRFANLVFTGDFNYKPSSKLLISIKANRDRQETSFASGGWNIGNNIDWSIVYKIRPRISVTLDGTFGRINYVRETTAVGKTKKREDYSTTNGVQIKWNPIRSLYFSIGYKFYTRASNFDNEGDYTANVLNTSVSYKLS